MPRTVVFEDDGLFILSAFFNGISHPPGYPVYTGLAHLATYIPTGSIALRVHVLSAFLGAAGCLCLWWLVNSWLKDRLYAAIAALAYGFSATFWSQAIIAEVYTLNVFLFLLLCILAVRWAASIDSERADRYLCLSGFIYGLGLCNHWPLLILSTPMLLALVWPERKLFLKKIHKPLLFMLPGLLPYAWMVLRSQMDPEISFYGPIESLSEFWYYVSRQGYEEADVNIGAGVPDKLRFCLFSLNETAGQFGYLLSPLVILGVLVQGKYLKKNVIWGLVFGFLGSSLLLSMLLGFNYDLLHRNIFKVYPLISYSIAAVWLVIGLKFLLESVLVRFISSVGIKSIQYAACFLIPVAVFMAGLSGNYRSEDNLAYYYARTILESLDRDAVFFTYVDSDTGPVGYLNRIENIRPDVTLYNSNGYLFNNRLFKPTDDQDHIHKVFSDYLMQETRPVYYMHGIPNLYGRTDYGLYQKIDKSLDRDLVTPVGKKEILGFFENIMKLEKLYDPWESMVLGLLKSDYCRLATYFYLNGIAGYQQDDLKRICVEFKARLNVVEMMLDYEHTDMAFMEQMLLSADEEQQELYTKDLAATHEYLLGRIRLVHGDDSAALEHFRRSRNIWPSDKNHSVKYLKKSGEEAGGE